MFRVVGQADRNWYAGLGEPVEAVAAQRRAIELFEAIRPLIAEHEVTKYEAELSEMQETLAKYVRQAGAER